MLESITIKGFKSIRDLQLDLKQLNVLIGANGSGKSNFISFFELLNNLIREKLQIYVKQKGSANNFLYFGRKKTDKISAYLKFQQNGYGFDLMPNDEDDFIISNESCDFYGPGYSQPCSESIPCGKKESTIKQHVQRSVVKFVYNELMSWRVYHFQDTSESARLKQTCFIGDSQRLQADASNIAAFLYMLKGVHPPHYTNIIEQIRLVVPFFDDFILDPEPLDKQSIRLKWKEVKSDQVFSAHTLSDGTLRFICITTLLKQPVQYMPGVIIIDEPELGLHPFAINVIAELLRGVSKTNQVIISTQSVTLVNQFNPEDIIVVGRQNQQSVFSSLNRKMLGTWLEDFSIGDIWEKNIIGGRP